MKRITLFRFSLAAVVLALLVCVGVAVAGPGSVESGGYLFFPRIKITSTDTTKPGISLEPGTKINLNGMAGTAALSGNSNNSIIVTGASLSRSSTATLGTNTNPWIAYASTLFAPTASGSNAIEFMNSGARLDLGSGANDYLYSDGTQIQTGGNFIANGSIYGSTVYHQSGGAFRASSNVVSTLIGSIRTAASTTSTAPAVLIKPDNALDSGDALLAVAKSDSTNVLVVDVDGNTTASGTVTAPNLILSAANAAIKDAGAGTRISLPNLNTTSIFGRAANGATAVGVVLDNTTTLSTLGARLASVRNNGSEVLNVRHDGSLQLPGVDTAGLLTCNASLAGGIQYDAAANMLKYCNGSAWVGLTGVVDTRETVAGGFYGGWNMDNTAFSSFHVANDGAKGVRIEWQHTVAGTGGTTMTLQLYNATGATSVCTFTVNCAAAAGTNVGTACTNALNGGSRYEFRVSASTCTTRPSGNINFTYTR